MNNVFEALRAIMLPMTDGLQVMCDEPGDFDVYTHHMLETGKPLRFGGVKLQEDHVSYCLMPVYMNPELLDDRSSALKQLMQGKSCFNIVEVDDSLLEEIALLTRLGLDDYVSEGFVTQE